MYVLTSDHQRVELVPVESKILVEAGDIILRASSIDDPVGRLSRAAYAFFGLGLKYGSRLATHAQARKEKPIGIFREKGTNRIRMVRKEIVVRFAKGTTAKRRDQILRKFRLILESRNSFIRNQFTVQTRWDRRVGADLIDPANKLMELDEVDFATPNFVSEYAREAIPTVQWHLKNTASVSGQKLGEDVNAEKAWTITKGDPSIVVSVLDDGVDVEHPNLKSQIMKNPDPSEPRDKCGRDFFIPDDNLPDHFDPRPKLFQFPFHRLAGNDNHGTPCAGIICAPGAGGGAIGIAPQCKVLPVKVFHADSLASDARVADAIRYASLHSDILSCSWSSGPSPDIEFAISEDAQDARGGKGAAVFCASGNGGTDTVSFPARVFDAIAVGASTDQAKLAGYSNTGPEISFVAPSSGGKRGIFTTDVGLPNRGFNVGNPAAGGGDGLHTNDFGGTSAATPLAAGIGALLLSKKPELTREELWNVLATTAEKIGSGYDADGHSTKFGNGRLDAFAALKELENL